MLAQQQQIQFSAFSGLYDLIVPKDNLLRKINELINFTFIHEELVGKYSLHLHDHLHLIAQQSEHPAGQEESRAARQVTLEAPVPELTVRYRAAKKKLFALVGEIVKENKFLAG